MLTDTNVVVRRSWSPSTRFAKVIITNIVGASASFAVTRLLHANCPTYTTTDKVKLYIGAYAIGGIVAGKAVDYASEVFDDVAKSLDLLLWVPGGARSLDPRRRDRPCRHHRAVTQRPYTPTRCMVFLFSEGALNGIP